MKTSLAVAFALALVSPTFAQTYRDSGGTVIPGVANAGTTGRDYSANPPAAPNVGGNFGGTGPYAGYFLTATVAPNAARFFLDVENSSGSQIACVLDDGTMAAGSQPTNATIIPLSGGGSVGAQGGSWPYPYDKGRLQIYSPITTAIAFTGSLAATTSATLNAAWAGSTGNIYVTFSDGSVRLAAFVSGGTSVSWTGAVTASASANAATAFVSIRQD